MKINTFDIDGVINFEKYDGLYPGCNDIIITGRSVEESFETLKMLKDKGIRNQVYFNPLPFSKPTLSVKGFPVLGFIDCGSIFLPEGSVTS